MTAYAEWALGTSRGDSGPRIVTALDPETGRDRSRATRGTRTSAAGSRSSTSAGGRRRGPPTGPSSSAATAPRTGRPASTAATALRGTVGRRAWTRAPRCRPSFELADGARTQVLVLLGEAADAAAAADLVAPRPVGRPRGARCARCATLLGRRPGRRPGADARPLDGHHAQRLAALPDARLPPLGPDRVLPGRRRLRVPRPAPGRHRPGDRHAATCAGSTSCGPPPTSSPRATCSTGGIRRRAAASGPGSPTTALWLPYAVDRYLAVTGDTSRSSTRPSPTSRGPPLRAGPGRRLLPARTLAGVGIRCTTTARRAIDRSLAVGAPRPAAHRLGRLERRHEPGRPRGPGRERLAGLVPAHGAGRVRADRRGARRTRPGGARGGPT